MTVPPGKPDFTIAIHSDDYIRLFEPELAMVALLIMNLAPAGKRSNLDPMMLLALLAIGEGMSFLADHANLEEYASEDVKQRFNARVIAWSEAQAAPAVEEWEQLLKEGKQ